MKKYISEIVLKICSRCNINCSYCYMYNMGDTSYLNQPKFIDLKIVEELSKKIKKHCNDNDIHNFSITLHGGEPLLYGKNKTSKLLDILKSIEDENLQVKISIQTNGILIDDEWCKIFKDYNLNIGISLDGPKETNDTNRVNFKGNGTYDEVVKGIEICKNNNIKFGILSVVNPNISPNLAYNHLKELDVKGVDFLILDENYDNFNEFLPNVVSNWLISVFNLWFEERETISIRIFENIIKGVYGLNFSADSYGSSTNNAIIIETNGSIETLDVLKICGEKFTKNTLNILSNDLNEVFENDLINLYFFSNTLLSKKCLSCPVNEICAGGYIPHRYSSKNGFNNPSIYCDDLLNLIIHIQNKLIELMPIELIAESNLEKLNYNLAIEIINKNIVLVENPSYVDFLEKFKK